MADYAKVVQKTLHIEGGYVNDPDDAGGGTYKGISRRYHPTWSGWEYIDLAKRQPDFPANLESFPNLQKCVLTFYKGNFWDRFCGNEIPDPKIAEELFDTSVNMGLHRTMSFLQTALNILNRNQKLYNDIEVDGVLGRKTLAK